MMENSKLLWVQPTIPDEKLPIDRELLDAVLESPKFRKWKPHKPKVLKAPAGRTGEAHYSPQELASVWGVSAKVIRQIFRQEEGVLKVGRDGTRNRQRYWTLRIPESVAERVHRRLSA